MPELDDWLEGFNTGFQKYFNWYPGVDLKIIAWKLELYKSEQATLYIE